MVVLLTVIFTIELNILNWKWTFWITSDKSNKNNEKITKGV